MISAPVAITVVSLDDDHVRILWTHPPPPPGTCTVVGRDISHRPDAGDDRQPAGSARLV